MRRAAREACAAAARRARETARRDARFETRSTAMSLATRCGDDARWTTRERAERAWRSAVWRRGGAGGGARAYASGTYPPHEVIPFPSLSPTMTRGGIASWKKAEGDRVETGDILAEVQTDKAVMEMESMEEGYLAKILVPSGDADDIPVGKAVCVMCESAEDVAAFKDYVAEETVGGDDDDRDGE